MLISDIIVEGYTATWGRKAGGKMVRRYRCTDGKKKGRVVAKASTCTSEVNPRASVNMKKTRRSKSRTQSVKRSIRMKHPTSIRIAKANKSGKYKRIKPRKKSK